MSEPTWVALLSDGTRTYLSAPSPRDARRLLAAQHYPRVIRISPVEAAK